MQVAVGADDAAAVGGRALPDRSVKRPPASSHDDLERGQVPQRDFRLGGDVDRALGDQHVRPEVPVRAGPPDRPGQREEPVEPARGPPSRRGSSRRTTRR